MPSRLNSRLQEVLTVRAENGLLRELRPPRCSSSDFSSNDYLGLARPGPFQRFIQHSELIEACTTSGATGSRLLSGHSKNNDKLERTAAEFHRAEASLLFNSGYDANLSLLSCLPGSEDAIVYDERIHASVHDGMRASRARLNTKPFLHNDIISLRRVIMEVSLQNSGNVLVCVETVYSMDGDVSPLKEILEVARATSVELGRDVYVIADEAHAGGLYGRNGEGLAVQLEVNHHPHMIARVITFGKAFAAHGAVVIGSRLLIQYLINYARPFIYSTALPPHSVAVLIAVYAFAQTADARTARTMLWERVEFFQRKSSELLPPQLLLPANGKSPIQGILAPGNRECVALSQILREQGFDVYPIRSPTVPRGAERIRLIIHAHNTEDEIRRLIEATARAYPKRNAKL